ncbi:MAG: hypothetical protein ACK6DC_19360 [Planctomycetota bacterium]
MVVTKLTAAPILSIRKQFMNIRRWLAEHSNCDAARLAARRDPAWST